MIMKQSTTAHIVMKLIYFQMIRFFYFVMWENIETTYIRNSVLLSICAFLLTGCAPKVSLQIERPAAQRVENINYIEIGKFKIVSGQIKLPSSVESGSNHSFSRSDKLLKPTISKFNSNKEQASQIADLLRAALVHNLSLHSPYKLINTTGKETGFSGVLPDAAKVAILQGKVKYFERIIESEEALSYFTNIKNRGATLEQSLLASAVSMGAESYGAGFLIPTPYVEQLATLEVEFTLINKNDGIDVVPPQIIRTYYVRKWGGAPNTSHLPRNIKTAIIEGFEQDEDNSESFLSRIDRAGLSFTNPTEYFARGFNLKQNVQVPQTSLDLKIRLGRQVAQTYVKQISPFHETADLLVQDGNTVASTLIRGNAYQEAVAYLQGLEELTAKDEYNLGLAFEASGEIPQARNHYELALKRESSNQDFKDAVKRTRN